MDEMKRIEKIKLEDMPHKILGSTHPDPIHKIDMIHKAIDETHKLQDHAQNQQLIATGVLNMARATWNNNSVGNLNNILSWTVEQENPLVTKAYQGNLIFKRNPSPCPKNIKVQVFNKQDKNPIATTMINFNPYLILHDGLYMHIHIDVGISSNPEGTDSNALIIDSKTNIHIVKMAENLNTSDFGLLNIQFLSSL